MKFRILIIDDEENIRFTFEKFLFDAGYDVETARNYQEALDVIDTSYFDLIFVDIILDGKTGIDILKRVKEMKLNCLVIMITGAPSIETSLDALRLGAFDYVLKPIRQQTLLNVTNRALQHKALVDEKEKYRLNLDAIFSSVKDAIITVDRDMRILETNDAAKGICDLYRNAIGKSFDILPRYCSGRCLSAVKETVQKKQPVEIHRLECKHELRPDQIVNVMIYPLISGNIFSGTVFIVRDETHLADLERGIEKRQQLHNIVGKTERMQEIYSLIENITDIQTAVLITGEDGTGKELIAEALHYKGERRDKPFIRVNCSAVTEGLLESELFGHVKGAFTGAVQDRVGRFQRADGGTVFLDEIGDLSAKMQLQLLRILREQEFERLGDSTPIRVNIRIIAATSQNLKEKITRGEFREDLYYYLKAMEINLPPLRNRREDIPLLVNHFLNKFNKKLNREIVALSPDVKERFMEYAWPGNIRELESVLEYASILCQRDMITANHLPPEFNKSSVNKKIGELEHEEILLNKTIAANLLDINLSTIYRKVYNNRKSE